MEHEYVKKEIRRWHRNWKYVSSGVHLDALDDVKYYNKQALDDLSTYKGS